MIYNLISVKRIIAKVFTDLDLKEGDHRVSDMIEWAGEALEKIGSFPQFTNRVLGKDNIPPLEVVNYQAKLPVDFHNLIQVAYAKEKNGPYFPMRYATGSFDSGVVNSDMTTTVDKVSTSAMISLVMTLYALDYEDAVIKLNTEPSTVSILEGILGDTGNTLGSEHIAGSTTDTTYVIRHGYIKTNQESGWLMVAYQAIPVDLDGYPMVPDHISFSEALYWYITMKLLYVDWKTGKVSRDIYYDAKSSWNFYCKQAYGNAMMPNQDQMESIKNTWHKIIPELGDHSNFFSTMGQRQVVYNQNNVYSK